MKESKNYICSQFVNASGTFESVITQQQARHRLECLRRMSQKHKMQYPQLKVHCTETTGHLLALQTADAVIKSNLSALGFGDVEL